MAITQVATVKRKIVNAFKQFLPYSVLFYRHLNLGNKGIKKRLRTVDEKLAGLKGLLLKSGGRPSVLFSGYPKSGNTWARFILYNYEHILDHGITETLTFKELNSIQCGALENGIETYEEHNSRTVFFRSHLPFGEVSSLFDHCIYIHRHPMDALISMFHWRKNRVVSFSEFNEEIRSEMMDLDHFVLSWLPYWVAHHKLSLQRADIVLSYEAMKKDAYAVFEPAILRIYGSVDQEALKQSIEMSDFESLKKMSAKSEDKAGMGDKTFTGSFLRSGGSKQFAAVLSASTIAKSKRMLDREGVPADWP